MQLFLDPQQPLHLFFLHRVHRNARPAAHHILNVLARHNPRARIIEVVLVPQRPQILPLLALLIRVEPRLLELMVRNRVLHPVHDELDPLLHLGQLLGQGSLPQLHPRPRLVDQIDRLIRQEPIRNIPARVRHRERDRLIRVADTA